MAPGDWQFWTLFYYAKILMWENLLFSVFYLYIHTLLK